MKILLALLLLLAPMAILAQTCAGTGTFSWEAPTGQTIPTDIDGYSLRIDGVERYADTQTSVDMDALGVTWVVGQNYTFDLRSYKGTTYSNATSFVKFVESDGTTVIDESGEQNCNFVTVAPSQPDTPVIIP